jgi:palmitoyl-protein thioesterase
MVIYDHVDLREGMGDSCCDPRSMGKVKASIEEALPGVYVKSIRIGPTENDDRKATYFGNLNEQVAEVCAELAEDEELAGGFNAIGFSQGGQALRAYVERCNSPRVKNLVTFGSQHMGVADIPRCNGPNANWLCRMMRSIVEGQVYTKSVQEKIVQAQYFKDPKRYEQYLDSCIFLPDINNEGNEKNELYKENMLSLDRFIMIKFSDDDMVVPGESAWFGFYDQDLQVVPLEEQPIYREDWIGLKQLDEEGKLLFLEVPGKHVRPFIELSLNLRCKFHCSTLSMKL